ncbi:MAG: response regulator transcription factor [Oscillospiraceae bacterium]|nr:response regulator transcription factor [Oscillospiraceae bacterium]
MSRLLLVEDDPSISRSLAEFLQGEGFLVESAAGQSAAEALLGHGSFDLLLVDLALTDGSGFGVCAAAKQYGLPVIFVTASGDEGSVVAGLDMGADDYIAKPFRPRELVSRVRSVLRRCGSQSVITLGSVRVDTDKAVVMKDGMELSLSALEYRILLVFLSNRGRVLTRARLLEEIWDVAGDYVNDNTLTVYIKRLRDKLEDDPQQPSLIKTVRGIGYRVDE